jgi:hypothetical protein
LPEGISDISLTKLASPGSSQALVWNVRVQLHAARDFIGIATHVVADLARNSATAAKKHITNIFSDVFVFATILHGCQN